MTKKQVIRSIIFIVLVLWLLVHVTYIIRTNGDVKDRFVGFYADKHHHPWQLSVSMLFTLSGILLLSYACHRRPSLQNSRDCGS